MKIGDIYSKKNRLSAVYIVGFHPMADYVAVWHLDKETGFRWLNSPITWISYFTLINEYDKIY